jgi:hypothetical protein
MRYWRALLPQRLECNNRQTRASLNDLRDRVLGEPEISSDQAVGQAFLESEHLADLLVSGPLASLTADACPWSPFRL